jgi:hypothetical protein
MRLNAIVRAALRVAAALVWSIAFAQGTSSPSQTKGVDGQTPPRFDGNWSTKLTCPEKGNTEGYTWQFASVIRNSNFHGEHGTAGEPGYLLIEGRIAEDGTAKLSATGIVASRKYARGVFAHKGEEYNYDIKAQFQDTQGTGTKSAGLGIVGRTCTFDFVKQ